MLDETNCDAVMIGRGVLGNPWLIRDTVAYLENKTLPKEVTPKEKIEMCLKHLKYLSDLKNEKTALLEIRNHVAWYLKGLPKSNEIKNKIYQTSKIDDIISILKDYGKEMEYA